MVYAPQQPDTYEDGPISDETCTMCLLFYWRHWKYVYLWLHIADIWIYGIVVILHLQSLVCLDWNTPTAKLIFLDEKREKFFKQPTLGTRPDFDDTHYMRYYGRGLSLPFPQLCACFALKPPLMEPWQGHKGLRTFLRQNGILRNSPIAEKTCQDWRISIDTEITPIVPAAKAGILLLSAVHSGDGFCFQKRRSSPTWTLVLTQFSKHHEDQTRSKPRNEYRKSLKCAQKCAHDKNNMKKLIFNIYMNLRQGRTTCLTYITNN
jgi:hypothetical protein